MPRQWREAVLTCRPQAGIAGVHHPRPRAFWPVDALILSERLAAAGTMARRTRRRLGYLPRCSRNSITASRSSTSLRYMTAFT